ncbi:hypothetical protein PR202_ga29378 [Eleusine coracana subsp. coracana]|uniref:Uncharacterized protein n=1 Tax=Eleusine coracana subsp. coracana TaxID=191504 RepID=A0AAV5DLZ9_ELECO|nr:hypothetical protein PR202_ga29378 [Eleusine coracana subsp. coracana]
MGVSSSAPCPPRGHATAPPRKGGQRIGEHDEEGAPPKRHAPRALLRRGEPLRPLSQPSRGLTGGGDRRVWRGGLAGARKKAQRGRSGGAGGRSWMRPENHRI